MKIIAIGVGGFGRAWRDAYRECEIDIVGLVDPDKTALEEAREYTGLAEDYCFDGSNDNWLNIEADAALIASPPPHHFEHVGKCLKAGFHTLVVKPLALSLTDAKELVNLAEHHNRKLVVAQQKRYLPAFVRARELIADGVLGEIGVVRITLRVQGTAWESGFGWRKERTDPVLMGAGSHHFDLLRWILQRNALGVNAVSWNVPWSPFLGEASSLAYIEMEGKLPVSYDVSWAPKEEQIDFFSGWRIEGTDGVLTVDDAEIYLNGSALGMREKNVPTLDKLNIEVMHRFKEYVQVGTDPGITGADNINTLELLFATIESAKQRSWVSLASLSSIEKNS